MFPIEKIGEKGLVITMRDVFANNVNATIDSLRENKMGWRPRKTDSGLELVPVIVKAFRYNEDADFIQVIDDHGNYWCVYYAPGIGVFIEDSLPKPDEGPGQGWELLSWV